MATINYISDGKALEYTLPDGFSGDFIALTPNDANGKITLIKGTDYIISHGVIRFRYAPPAQAVISVADSIDDIVTPDVSADLALETQSRIELGENVDRLEAVTAQNSNDMQHFAEAYIQNSLAIEALSERVRNLENN